MAGGMEGDPKLFQRAEMEKASLAREQRHAGNSQPFPMLRVMTPPHLDLTCQAAQASAGAREPASLQASHKDLISPNTAAATPPTPAGFCSGRFSSLNLHPQSAVLHLCLVCVSTTHRSPPRPPAILTHGGIALSEMNIGGRHLPAFPYLVL